MEEGCLRRLPLDGAPTKWFASMPLMKAEMLSVQEVMRLVSQDEEAGFVSSLLQRAWMVQASFQSALHLYGVDSS